MASARCRWLAFARPCLPARVLPRESASDRRRGMKDAQARRLRHPPIARTVPGPFQGGSVTSSNSGETAISVRPCVAHDGPVTTCDSPGPWPLASGVCDRYTRARLIAAVTNRAVAPAQHIPVVVLGDKRGDGKAQGTTDTEGAVPHGGGRGDPVCGQNAPHDADARHPEGAPARRHAACAVHATWPFHHRCWRGRRTARWLLVGVRNSPLRQWGGQGGDMEEGLRVGEPVGTAIRKGDLAAVAELGVPCGFLSPAPRIRVSPTADSEPRRARRRGRR